MQNYYVKYVVLKPNTKVTGVEREFRTYKSTPIIALNDFHRSMQRTKEIDGKKKITRPRLNADEYQINRLFLRYYNAGETIESDFDIPKTKNPSIGLRKKTPKDAPKKTAVKNTEFAFMSE